MPIPTAGRQFHSGMVQRTVVDFRSLGPKYARKSVALLLALLLLGEAFTAPVAEANFWRDRRQNSPARSQSSDKSASPLQTASLANPLPPIAPSVAVNSIPFESMMAFEKSRRRLPDKIMTGLPQWATSVPAAYGDIQEAWSAPGAEKRPVVVLVQDAHGIESAQRNIAALLTALDQSYRLRGAGKRLVFGIEGASGKFSLAPFRRYDDRDVHAEVCDALLRAKLISGPEYFGLTAPSIPLLWGIESPELYLSNVEGYRNGLRIKDQMAKQHGRLSGRVARLKERMFSKDLLSLDATLDAYARGSLDPAKFIQALWPRVAGNDLDGLHQIALLKGLLDDEGSLDFKQIERERGSLVRSLAARISEADARRLVDYSAAYKSGRVGYGAYYDFLENLAERHGVSLRSFPAFESYIRYVLKSDRIDKYGLYGEMEELKRRLVARIVTDGEEGIVFQLAEDLRLIRRLMDRDISQAEWTVYQAAKPRLHRLSDQLRRLENPSTRRLSAADEKFQDGLLAMESFYRTAVDRNAALVGNLLKKMDEDGSSGAVIVAGGFHTPGLSALLRRENISHVVFTPKVGEIKEDPKRYLDVFAMNRSPLEKMLLGEQLNLNVPAVLSLELSRSIPGRVENFLREAIARDVFFTNKKTNSIEAVRRRVDTIQTLWGSFSKGLSIVLVSAGRGSVTVESSSDTMPPMRSLVQLRDSSLSLNNRVSLPRFIGWRFRKTRGRATLILPFWPWLLAALAERFGWAKGQDPKEWAKAEIEKSYMTYLVIPLVEQLFFLPLWLFKANLPLGLFLTVVWALVFASLHGLPPVFSRAPPQFRQTWRQFFLRFGGALAIGLLTYLPAAAYAASPAVSAPHIFSPLLAWWQGLPSQLIYPLAAIAGTAWHSHHNHMFPGARLLLRGAGNGWSRKTGVLILTPADLNYIRTEIYKNDPEGFDFALATAEKARGWDCSDEAYMAALLHRLPKERVRTSLTALNKYDKQRFNAFDPNTIHGLVVRMKLVREIPFRPPTKGHPFAIQDHMHALLAIAGSPDGLLLIMAERWEELVTTPDAGYHSEIQMFVRMVLRHLASRVGRRGIGQVLGMGSLARIIGRDNFDQFTRDLMEELVRIHDLSVEEAVKGKVERILKEKMKHWLSQHQELRVESVFARLKDEDVLLSKIKRKGLPKDISDGFGGNDLLGILVVFEDQQSLEQALDLEIWRSVDPDYENNWTIESQNKGSFRQTNIEFGRLEIKLMTKQDYEAYMRGPDAHPNYKARTDPYIRDYFSTPQQFEALNISMGPDYSINFQNLFGSIAGRFKSTVERHDLVRGRTVSVGPRELGLAFDETTGAVWMVDGSRPPSLPREMRFFKVSLDNLESNLAPNSELEKLNRRLHALGKKESLTVQVTGTPGGRHLNIVLTLPYRTTGILNKVAKLVQPVGSIVSYFANDTRNGRQLRVSVSLDGGSMGRVETENLKSSLSAIQVTREDALRIANLNARKYTLEVLASDRKGLVNDITDIFIAADQDIFIEDFFMSEDRVSSPVAAYLTAAGSPAERRLDGRPMKLVFHLEVPEGIDVLSVLRGVKELSAVSNVHLQEEEEWTASIERLGVKILHDPKKGQGVHDTVRFLEVFDVKLGLNLQFEIEEYVRTHPKGPLFLVSPEQVRRNNQSFIVDYNGQEIEVHMGKRVREIIRQHAREEFLDITDPYWFERSEEWAEMQSNIRSRDGLVRVSAVTESVVKVGDKYLLVQKGPRLVLLGDGIHYVNRQSLVDAFEARGFDGDTNSEREMDIRCIIPISQLTNFASHFVRGRLRENSGVSVARQLEEETQRGAVLSRPPAILFVSQHTDSDNINPSGARSKLLVYSRQPVVGHAPFILGSLQAFLSLLFPGVSKFSNWLLPLSWLEERAHVWQARRLGVDRNDIRVTLSADKSYTEILDEDWLNNNRANWAAVRFLIAGPMLWVRWSAAWIVAMILLSALHLPLGPPALLLCVAIEFPAAMMIMSHLYRARRDPGTSDVRQADNIINRRIQDFSSKLGRFFPHDPGQGFSGAVHSPLRGRNGGEKNIVNLITLLSLFRFFLQYLIVGGGLGLVYHLVLGGSLSVAIAIFIPWSAVGFVSLGLIAAIVVVQGRSGDLSEADRARLIPFLASDAFVGFRPMKGKLFSVTSEGLFADKRVLALFPKFFQYWLMAAVERFENARSVWSVHGGIFDIGGIWAGGLSMVSSMLALLVWGSPKPLEIIGVLTMIYLGYRVMAWLVLGYLSYWQYIITAEKSLHGGKSINQEARDSTLKDFLVGWMLSTGFVPRLYFKRLAGKAKPVAELGLDQLRAYTSAGTNEFGDVVGFEDGLTEADLDRIRAGLKDGQLHLIAENADNDWFRELIEHLVEMHDRGDSRELNALEPVDRQEAILKLYNRYFWPAVRKRLSIKKDSIAIALTGQGLGDNRSILLENPDMPVVEARISQGKFHNANEFKLRVRKAMVVRKDAEFIIFDHSVNTGFTVKRVVQELREMGVPGKNIHVVGFVADAKALSILLDDPALKDVSLHIGWLVKARRYVSKKGKIVGSALGSDTEIPPSGEKETVKMGMNSNSRRFRILETFQPGRPGEVLAWDLDHKTLRILKYYVGKAEINSMRRILQAVSGRRERFRNSFLIPEVIREEDGVKVLRDPRGIVIQDSRALVDPRGYILAGTTRMARLAAALRLAWQYWDIVLFLTMDTKSWFIVPESTLGYDVQSGRLVVKGLEGINLTQPVFGRIFWEAALMTVRWILHSQFPASDPWLALRGRERNPDSDAEFTRLMGQARRSGMDAATFEALKLMLGDIKQAVEPWLWDIYVTEHEHGLHHSLEVLRHSLNFGKKIVDSDLTDHETEALRAAWRTGEGQTILIGISLFHDLFSVIDRDNHELEGARLSTQVLSKANGVRARPAYSDRIVESVYNGCVRHRGQGEYQPVTILEKIFVDVDELAAINMERLWAMTDPSIVNPNTWMIYRFYTMDERPLLSGSKKESDSSSDSVPLRFVHENPGKADKLQYILFSLFYRTNPIRYHTFPAAEYLEEKFNYQTTKNLALARLRQELLTDDKLLPSINGETLSAEQAYSRVQWIVSRVEDVLRADSAPVRESFESFDDASKDFKAGLRFLEAYMANPKVEGNDNSGMSVQAWFKDSGVADWNEFLNGFFSGLETVLDDLEVYYASALRNGGKSEDPIHAFVRDGHSFVGRIRDEFSSLPQGVLADKVEQLLLMFGKTLSNIDEKTFGPYDLRPADDGAQEDGLPGNVYSPVPGKWLFGWLGRVFRPLSWLEEHVAHELAAKKRSIANADYSVEVNSRESYFQFSEDWLNERRDDKAISAVLWAGPMFWLWITVPLSFLWVAVSSVLLPALNLAPPTAFFSVAIPLMLLAPSILMSFFHVRLALIDPSRSDIYLAGHPELFKGKAYSPASRVPEKVFASTLTSRRGATVEWKDLYRAIAALEKALPDGSHDNDLWGLADYVRQGNPGLDPETVFAWRRVLIPTDMLSLMEKIYAESGETDPRAITFFAQCRKEFQTEYGQFKKERQDETPYSGFVQFPTNGRPRAYGKHADDAPTLDAEGVHFRLHAGDDMHHAIFQYLMGIKDDDEALGRVARALAGTAYETSRDPDVLAEGLTRHAVDHPEQVFLAGNFLESKPWGHGLKIDGRDVDDGALEGGWRTPRGATRYSPESGWEWRMNVELLPVFDKPKYILYRFLLRIPLQDGTVEQIYFSDPANAWTTTDHNSMFMLRRNDDIPAKNIKPGRMIYQYNMDAETPPGKSPVRYLIERLPWFRAMGYDILLGPGTLSPSESVYSPTYFTYAQWGTSDDFADLHRAAISNGLWVFMDVVRHTSADHLPFPENDYLRAYLSIDGRWDVTSPLGRLGAWNMLLDDQSAEAVYHRLWAIDALGYLPLPDKMELRTQAKRIRETDKSVEEGGFAIRSDQYGTDNAIPLAMARRMGGLRPLLAEWNEKKSQRYTDMRYAEKLRELLTQGRPIPYWEIEQEAGKDLERWYGEQVIFMLNNHDKAWWPNGEGGYGISAYAAGAPIGRETDQIRSRVMAFFLEVIKNMDAAGLMFYSGDRQATREKIGFERDDRRGYIDELAEDHVLGAAESRYQKTFDAAASILTALRRNGGQGGRADTGNDFVGGAFARVGSDIRLLMTNTLDSSVGVKLAFKLNWFMDERDTKDVAFIKFTDSVTQEEGVFSREELNDGRLAFNLDGYATPIYEIEFIDNEGRRFKVVAGANGTPERVYLPAERDQAALSAKTSVLDEGIPKPEPVRFLSPGEIGKRLRDNYPGWAVRTTVQARLWSDANPGLQALLGWSVTRLLSLAGKILSPSAGYDRLLKTVNALWNESRNWQSLSTLFRGSRPIVINILNVDIPTSDLGRSLRALSSMNPRSPIVVLCENTDQSATGINPSDKRSNIQFVALGDVSAEVPWSDVRRTLLEREILNEAQISAINSILQHPKAVPLELPAGIAVEILDILIVSRYLDYLDRLNRFIGQFA